MFKKLLFTPKPRFNIICTKPYRQFNTKLNKTFKQNPLPNKIFEGRLNLKPDITHELYNYTMINDIKKKLKLKNTADIYNSIDLDIKNKIDDYKYIENELRNNNGYITEQYKIFNATKNNTSDDIFWFVFPITIVCSMCMYFN